ncbi:hypothetical protein GOBAR_DD19806 [Gossypium barbadense]|nr:hypothetical protein GOBAR_DD19806 [Gossypium barbadense]
MATENSVSFSSKEKDELLHSKKKVKKPNGVLFREFKSIISYNIPYSIENLGIMNVSWILDQKIWRRKMLRVPFQSLRIRWMRKTKNNAFY